MLLTVTAGYGQDPVINPDSIPAKPAGLVPDCDRYGSSFRRYQGGEWVFHPQADLCYAEVLRYIGEANLPTDDAIPFVEQAVQYNARQTGLYGYVGAVCWNGSEYCTAFSEKLTHFDGYFLSRINAKWSLYLREGCLNLTVVYDPLSPKGGAETPPPPVPPLPTKCDTIVVICEAPECPEIPAPVIQQVCCEVPKLSWTYFYPMVGVRSTYDSDICREPWFLGLGVRQHWRDSTQLSSTYAGVETSFSMREKTSFTCDTCVEFTNEAPIKPAVRAEVFVGREFGIRENSKFLGFVEARYAVLQPQVLPGVNDRKFLPKQSGLTTRGGVRYNVNKSLQAQASFEYDPLAKLAGGEVRIIANLVRGEETRQQEKQERAREQFLRDSVAREERLRADSIAVANFFEFNLDTVQIAQAELQPDAKYVDPEPQRVVGIEFQTLRNVRGMKINKARTEVLALQKEHNQLRLQMKVNPAKWSEFQTNSKKLKKAERELRRLEKKARIERSWVDDWSRS